MFSLMVQLEVRPERREEFLSAIAVNAQTSVRDEPGCLRFDVCSVEGDENRFILYELYTDATAFEAHKQAPHFAEWRRVADQVLVFQGITRGALLHSHTEESA